MRQLSVSEFHPPFLLRTVKSQLYVYYGHGVAFLRVTGGREGRNRPGRKVCRHRFLVYYCSGLFLSSLAFELHSQLL